MCGLFVADSRLFDSLILLSEPGFIGLKDWQPAWATDSPLPTRDDSTNRWAIKPAHPTLDRGLFLSFPYSSVGTVCGAPALRQQDAGASGDAFHSHGDRGNLEFGLLLPLPLREGVGGWGKSLTGNDPL